jgi:diguanylate cyclase (GGDEF)-like protein/PAS domain S-box-containing protein
VSSARVRDLADLSGIVDTQRAIASAGLDFESVMRVVCERTQELTQADGTAIQLLDGEELYYGAVLGLLASRRDFRTKLDRSLSGWCIARGEVAKCDELLEDERVDPRGARELGVRSMIVVPLLHGDETVGVLQALSKEPGYFTDRDVRTLELLAVVVSAAMSHASSFRALARFRAIYEGAAIAIVLVDRRGRVVECNETLTELLGYGPAEVVGRSLNDFTHPSDITAGALAFDQLMHGERDRYRLERRYLARNGDVLWGQVAVSLVRDANGEPEFAIEMIENATERKLAEEQLRVYAEQSEYQALHDALTGLPNRVLFRDRIEHELARLERENAGLAVALVDLDRFKEINDTLGHASGDHVLREVADRLQGCLRGSDTVARLGGDEFGLVLPGQGGRDELTSLLDKLRAAVEEPIELDGLPLAVEASIGVALAPRDGRSVEELLQRADIAMYEAKHENRPYAFYERGADHHDPLQLTVVAELRSAIAQGELVLHYQPQAALSDGRVERVEALLRWVHPSRGLLGADEFIPQALETGLMKPLTLFVLDEAVRQVRHWRDDGLDVAVSVNVGTRNLLDSAFPDDVAGVLERWSVDPSRLELEITESTILGDPFRTRIVLERLHRLGVRLSIDDFGTGYSSLAYLRELPVAEIKIDRSFVLGMEREESGNAVIVRAAVDLGRNLGLTVVAEGVETDAAWQALAGLGCELAQGFLLSHPLPPEELAAWLRTREAGATLGP